jgi:hypothetical protein
MMRERAWGPPCDRLSLRSSTRSASPAGPLAPPVQGADRSPPWTGPRPPASRARPPRENGEGRKFAERVDSPLTGG